MAGRLQLNSKTTIDFQDGKPFCCNFNMFGSVDETRQYADAMIRNMVVNALKWCGWDVELGDFKYEFAHNYTAQIKVIEPNENQQPPKSVSYEGRPVSPPPPPAPKI